MKHRLAYSREIQDPTQDAGPIRDSVELTDTDTFDILGLEQGVTPGQTITVTAHDSDGTETTFDTIARIDRAIEVEYYAHGGVLPMALRRMLTTTVDATNES